MNVEYDILLTVFFKHRYFSDSKLNCLSVFPDPVTQTFINNNGLLFKSFKDGFRILYESKNSTIVNRREDLTDGTSVLRFVVSLNDNNFFNYTSDFGNDVSSTLCYFQNIKQTDHSNTTLHSGEFVSVNDILNANELKGAFEHKPFGVMDICLHKELPLELSVKFSEKVTYWRYIIVGEHLKELNGLAVLNDKMVFSGPETMILPDNKVGFVFQSVSPLSIFQMSKNRFQLVENYDASTSKYKVVLKALPVPDISSISKLPRKEETGAYNYSEIFIY